MCEGCTKGSAADEQILSSHPDCEKRDPRCPGNNNWRDVKQLVKEAQGRVRSNAVGI